MFFQCKIRLFFFNLGWKDVSSSIINAIFNIHICIFSDSQVCNVCHFNETQSLIFPAHLNLITMISVMVSHIFTSFHNNLYFPPPQVYPYLVVNDACLTESRREERVLQLLRMMNHFLTKQKETLRRLLYFTVPRVVAISPQMRLVEDNPASVSLLDVYKQVGDHNFSLIPPSL